MHDISQWSIHLLEDKSAFVFFSGKSSKTYTVRFDYCMPKLSQFFSSTEIEELLHSKDYLKLMVPTGILEEIEK